MLFTMYIKPLSAIIDSHSIIHHSFADDLQLQMSAPPDRISELLHSIQPCMSDVKAWASVNMLNLMTIKSFGVVVRMSILDTKVDGSIPSINMFYP